MYWFNRSSINQLNGLNRLLQEMDDTFRPREEAYSNLSAYPKVNVWKDKDAIVITAEIPGIDLKGIELNAHEDKLVISGEIQGRERVEGDAYHLSERSTGKFHRELSLPFRINLNTANASYKNGILKIDLKRAEEDKPKKITVKAA